MSYTFSPSPASPLDFELYSQRYAILAIFSMLGLLNTLLCYSLAPILHLAKFIYGPDVDFTTLVSSFFIIYCFMSFPCSYALERFGLRRMVCCAAWLQTLGAAMRCIQMPLAALPFMTPYAWLLSGQVLCALAQCVTTNGPALLAQTWFGSKERNLSTAISVNFTTLGVAAAYLLAPYLVNTPADIQCYLVLCAVLTAAAAVCATLFFAAQPPTPPSLSQQHKLQEQARHARYRVAKSLARSGDSQSPSQHDERISLLHPVVPPVMNLANHSNNGHNNSNNKIDASESEPVSPPLYVLRPLDLICHQPLMHPNLSPKGEPCHSQPLSRTQFRQLLHMFTKHAGFMHCVAAFAVSEMLINIFSACMSLVLRPNGFHSKVIGHITCLFILSCLFGSAVLGYIVDRFKLYQSTLICAFGCTAIAVVALVYSGSNTLYVVVSVCVCGLFMGSIQPISLEAGVEVSWPSDAASVAAVLQVVGNLLSAASLPLIMYLRDRDHSRMDSSLYLLALMLAVLALSWCFFRGQFRRIAHEQQQERSAFTEWQRQVAEHDKQQQQQYSQHHNNSVPTPSHAQHQSQHQPPFLNGRPFGANSHHQQQQPQQHQQLPKSHARSAVAFQASQPRDSH